MAKSHGKSAVFKLDDSGGSLRDLSSDCDTTELAREVSTAETTTFGATGSARTFVAGLINANIPFGGKWDNAANQVDAVLSGILGQSATVSWEYGPTGSTAGMVKYSGEAIVTSYTTSSGFDGAVTFSGALQVTGVVTRGTW